MSASPNVNLPGSVTVQHKFEGTAGRASTSTSQLSPNVDLTNAAIAPPPTNSQGDTMNTPKSEDWAKRSTLPKTISFPKIEIEEEVLIRLRRWIVCFAIVEFDLDIGPDLDNDYPPTRFTPSLKANIAFSSLPEGDLPTAGAYTYSWRIPVSPPVLPFSNSTTPLNTIGETVEADSNSAKNKNGLLSQKLLPPDILPDVDGFLYGFVYFMQTKNELLRRGYSQKSLVLISHKPSFAGLFSNTISLLGPLHFKHPGGGMVETACHNIANWPDPEPGSTLDLPFLGTVQTVVIPLLNQPQWHNTPLRINREQTFVELIPASIPRTPLSTAFHAGILTFSKILLLWELLLLGEPVLVYSSDPRTASELVHHLRNMVRPIQFSGDYRPYFHIHDSDYNRIATVSKPSPGTVVGCTNPLVLSTLKHWPHVVKTHSTGKSGVIVTSKSSGGGAGSGLGGDGSGIGGEASSSGLQSDRKRHVKKDPRAAKLVEDAFKRGNYLECDALIFRHLATLTEQFLSPLNRYFGTLPSTDTSLGAPPSSRSFQTTQFIASLKSYGTALQFRSTNLSSQPGTTVERFYLRFLKSPNFASWLHQRTDLAGVEVKRKYLERLEKVDVENWVNQGSSGSGQNGDRREDKEVWELVERMEIEADLSDARMIPQDGIETGGNESTSKLPSPLGINVSSLLVPPFHHLDLDERLRDPERSGKLRRQASRLRSLKGFPAAPASASGASSRDESPHRSPSRSSVRSDFCHSGERSSVEKNHFASGAE